MPKSPNTRHEFGVGDDRPGDQVRTQGISQYKHEKKIRWQHFCGFLLEPRKLLHGENRELSDQIPFLPNLPISSFGYLVVLHAGSMESETFATRQYLTMLLVVCEEVTPTWKRDHKRTQAISQDSHNKQSLLKYQSEPISSATGTHDRCSKSFYFRINREKLKSNEPSPDHIMVREQNGIKWL